MKIDKAILTHGLTKSQSFFLGCWFNMSHGQSLDADRVSLLNPQNSLQELLDLYEFGESYGGDEKRTIVAFELRQILINDRVLKHEIFADLKDELVANFAPDRNTSSSNGSIKTKKELIISIARQLQDLIGKHYLNIAFDLLQETIAKRVDDKESQALIFKGVMHLCNIIMSTLITSGVGLQELASFYRYILTNTKYNNLYERRFSKLIDAVFKQPQAFTVQYILRSNLLSQMVTDVGGAFSFGLFSVSKLNKNQCEATATIKAPSFSIAGMKGFDLLGELVDAVSYTLGKEHIIIEKKCVAANKNGITKSFDIYKTVPNPNYQLNKEKFLSFIQSVSSRETNEYSGFENKKIASALRLYRMGEASSSIEARFTSYWTALESITRDAFTQIQGDDKRVIAATVPCISADYVCKRLISFLRALHNLNILTVKSGDDTVSLKNMSTVNFYLHLKNTGLATALLNQLDDYPYFQFRIANFISLCQSPSDMGLAIAKHEEKVSLQLQRLYRARNIIVHKADKVLGLELLCANLEHYLKICLNSMIDLMSSIPTIRTPEECFIRYDNLITKTKIELNPALRKNNGAERDKLLKKQAQNPPKYSDTNLIKLIELHG